MGVGVVIIGLAHSGGSSIRRVYGRQRERESECEYGDARGHSSLKSIVYNHFLSWKSFQAVVHSLKDYAQSSIQCSQLPFS